MIINSTISDSKIKIENLIKLILTKYYNHDDITLNITYNNTMCNHFSTEDIELDAYLDKINDKTYNLILRENSILKEVIPHELVHLHQYEIGDLKVDRNKKVFIWKGESYDYSTPYRDRPWEKEALKLQRVLWKKFKKQCVY